jgi:hypothetical protein
MKNINNSGFQKVKKSGSGKSGVKEVLISEGS